MATVFNWIRPGYDLVKLKFDWNVQVPFLQTTEWSERKINSSVFTSERTNSKWKLGLFDDGTKISIGAFHYNSEEISTKIVDPVLVKISILNGNGRKDFQQMHPSYQNLTYVKFQLTKQELILADCQQADGSCTFCCKIIFHVRKERVASLNPPHLAMDCSGVLSTQLEDLFEETKFSDVIFNIHDRQFPAHKSILAARSEVFDAMFQHPTKEKLTNKIEIEDIEPDVFHELLRFIYTGRLSTTTMKKMATGLFIAADKYLLADLKWECENYLLRQMSPTNCVELLLHGDLLNPAEHLKKVMKEAAKFFRRLPSEVMATSKWEKMEEEKPKKLFQIQKNLFSNKQF